MFEAVPNSSPSIFCTLATYAVMQAPHAIDGPQHLLPQQGQRLHTHMHHISCQDSHLIFRRHDETDHGCAVASSFLQGFDKLQHRVKHVTIAMARSSQAVNKAVSLHPYPLDLPYLHLRLAALLALVTHVDSYNSRVRERSLKLSLASFNELDRDD